MKPTPEQATKKANQEASQSARWLLEVHQMVESYKAEPEKLRRENRAPCNTIVELEMIVDESKQKLAHLDAAIPIKK